MGNAPKTYNAVGTIHRTTSQVIWLRERSPCSRVLEIVEISFREQELETLFACNLNKNTEKRLLRFARNDIKMDVLHQARRCGAAPEPRKGGARKTKGDPRLRGDDIRLKPGGLLPLNIQKTPQMRQSCRLSYSDIYSMYICTNEVLCW